MKNGYKLGLAAIAASISLVGCGSDSTSTATVTETPIATVTGQFVDTYVAGLNYECTSGTTGVTNSMGEYTCNQGDTVEFSLGGYFLGSATASSGIVTPETLYPSDTDVISPEAMNVAQLLQTLDTDPNDDIITIPAEFTALDDVNITLEDENFDELINTELVDVSLITEEEAQNHLDETELMLLLAGETFYNVGSDNTGDNWIDSIVFNSDATSLVWTSLTSTESGTNSIVIEGDKIIIDGEGGTFELTLVEEATDKLVFQGLDASGAVVEEDFMFFEQAAAEAYYDSLQPEPTTTEPTTTEPTTMAITEAMLSSKTFYHYENEVQYNEEIYAKMTLNAGVLTRTEVINGAAPDTFTVPYTIIEGKVRIDVPAMEGDPAEYIWWTLLSETADSWTLKDEDDQNQDGSIEFTNTLTLYLSKPADYPASL